MFNTKMWSWPSLMPPRRNRESHGSDATLEHSDRPSRRPGHAQTLAIISILTLVSAFILSFLCLFAGNHPGLLEEYAILTLNISRIGENLKDDFDLKIASIDFNFKRSLQMSPVQAPAPMITAPATTLIEVRAPLDIGNGFGKATSDVGSLGSDVKSKVTSLKSKAKSEATHVGGEVTSAIDRGLTAVQSEVIKLVNQAYEGIIDGLNLEDFYSLHLMTTCYGHYVTSDGKNISVGGSIMPDNGTHKHADKCEHHSALDPVQALRVAFIVGILFISLALGGAIVSGVFNRGHRGVGILNIIVTGIAFLIIALATAIAHGVSFGAIKLINFVGHSVGVEGEIGEFVRLAWATVGLLGVSAILSGVVGHLRHREQKGEKDILKIHYRPQGPDSGYEMGQRTKRP